jgi:hypothetical protein
MLQRRVLTALDLNKRKNGGALRNAIKKMIDSSHFPKACLRNLELLTKKDFDLTHKKKC